MQWFERARFELHPEHKPPYNVLLGLLGNELRASIPPPQPTPTLAPYPAPPTATPILAAPTSGPYPPPQSD